MSPALPTPEGEDRSKEAAGAFPPAGDKHRDGFPGFLLVPLFPFLLVETHPQKLACKRDSTFVLKKQKT